MRLSPPAGRRLCDVFVAALLILGSIPARAERSDTAPPPLSAAEVRARALLLETDRETLAPPEWGVLQKPQPLVSPSVAPAAVTDAASTTTTAAAAPGAVPRGQRGRGIDPVVIAMIALGVASLATLLALAVSSLRRDRDEGPSSILPR